MQNVKDVLDCVLCLSFLAYCYVILLPHFTGSLSDRKPVEAEDELVVMVVPDYQMLEYVERIASNLSDDPVSTYPPQSLSETILKICFFC